MEKRVPTVYPEVSRIHPPTCRWFLSFSSSQRWQLEQVYVLSFACELSQSPLGHELFSQSSCKKCSVQMRYKIGTFLSISLSLSLSHSQTHSITNLLIHTHSLFQKKVYHLVTIFSDFHIFTFLSCNIM